MGSTNLGELILVELGSTNLGELILVELGSGKGNLVKELRTVTGRLPVT